MIVPLVSGSSHGIPSDRVKVRRGGWAWSHLGGLKSMRHVSRSDSAFFPLAQSHGSGISSRSCVMTRPFMSWIRARKATSMGSLRRNHRSRYERQLENNANGGKRVPNSMQQVILKLKLAWRISQVPRGSPCGGVEEWSGYRPSSMTFVYAHSVLLEQLEK